MESKNRKPEVRQLTVKQRLGAVICSAALAASSIAGPVAAFADEIQPTVTGNDTVSTSQTGTGATDVTIQLKYGSQEMGGTDQPKVIEAPEGTASEDLVDADGNPDPTGGYILNPLYNPDEDGDGLGDNLAFTVPTSINFVSDSHGKLTGPSSDVTFIENESIFAIYASSANVVAQNNWTLVGDAEADTSGTSNIVDFQWGPKSGTLLDAATYESASKQAIPNAQLSEWQMAYGKTDATDKSDRVELKTQGNIANVNQEIKDRTKVAIIHTYVTPGEAPA